MAENDEKLDLPAGRAAFLGGDYDLAFNILLPLADGNPPDPQAAFFVGEIYRSGVSIPQDYALAVRYLTIAAEGDEIRAWIAIAKLALAENVDYVSPADGVKWLHRAAKAGDVESQFRLAALYRQDPEQILRDKLEIKHDLDKSVYWLRRAADQGYPYALHNMSIQYKLGIGVPQDFERAYEYALLAVARRNAVGEASEMALHVENRDDLIKSLTNAAVLSAQASARARIPAPMEWVSPTSDLSGQGPDV